jgi:hypothetical protein
MVNFQEDWIMIPDAGRARTTIISLNRIIPEILFLAKLRMVSAVSGAIRENSMERRIIRKRPIFNMPEKHSIMNENRIPKRSMNEMRYMTKSGRERGKIR